MTYSTQEDVDTQFRALIATQLVKQNNGTLFNFLQPLRLVKTKL